MFSYKISIKTYKNVNYFAQRYTMVVVRTFLIGKILCFDDFEFPFEYEKVKEDI